MKILIEKKLLLLSILALAAFLRLYQLDSVPPSPSLDEVSIGYNAYSILRTGADEYGTKFPIVLRAYDDYRPALYVYLVIPFIQLLGLTVVAVRLPSVIASIVTVFLTYLVVKELFHKAFDGNHVEIIALSSSALLAISPWHIYISRLGHEANIGLFLVVLGAYLFFRAVNRKQGTWLMVSAAVFALSLNSYQSEKIISPLLVFMLSLLYRKELLSMKRSVLRAMVLGVIVSLPTLVATFAPSGLVRFSTTSILADSQLLHDQQQLYRISVEKGDILGQIINRRKMYAAGVIARQYIDHFNPSWIFTGGDFESHKVPGLGLLFSWEAPLIVWGLSALYTKMAKAKLAAVIAVWLLVSPIPAAITSQSPHAMRSYTFLPVWQILGAVGVGEIFLFLKRKKSLYLTQAVSAVFFIVIVSSILYFMKQYFQVFPVTQSASFQYALGKTIAYVHQNEEKYQHIVFSNKNSLYQSYMFYLYYTGYDPIRYSAMGGTKSGGFSESHIIGTYEFRPIDWAGETRNGLYVGNVAEFPDGVTGTTISYLDGTPAIKIVEKSL